MRQAADLTLEHVLEAIVIADRGQDGGVGGQRDGRQRVSIKVEPRQELARDMLSIGGAAAIAGNEKLVSVAQCGCDRLSGADHGLQHLAVGGGALECFTRAAKMLRDAVFA